MIVPDRLFVVWMPLLDLYAGYGKMVKSAIHAECFANFAVASSVCRFLHREYPQLVGLEVMELAGRTKLLAQRYWLKRDARLRFGFPINCPRGILADRYDDAGMHEEATLLRDPVNPRKETVDA